jgi:clathrin heavy chain
MKANDPEYYNEVIYAANSGAFFEDLVKYLEMCNKKLKEPRIESELVYAYAKTAKHSELESFINNPSCCANVRILTKTKLKRLLTVI